MKSSLVSASVYSKYFEPNFTIIRNKSIILFCKKTGCENFLKIFVCRRVGIAKTDVYIA